MLQGLFECVRAKVRCRDPAKIPTKRLFEIEGKIFKVQIVVEVPARDKNEKEKGSGESGGDKSDESSKDQNMLTDKGDGQDDE